MNLAAGILLTILGVVCSLVLVGVAFTAYVLWAYGGHVVRIFQTRPLLLAPQGRPAGDAEDVSIRTRSGRRLAASYLRRKIDPRRGVLLFCHEFGANRWLADGYAGYLREHGYDVFTFDFSNHGESEAIAGYEPLQWATTHEVEDVAAAIDYLKNRPDAPESIALFGVSKGGSAGLVAAGADPFVRCVITDGAFPTHGTVTYYEMQWIEIYSPSWFIYRYLPRWFYALVCEYALWKLARGRGVTYSRVERGMARLAGRPVLMIHGMRDNYIRREIVEALCKLAGPTAELWLVKGAKHNACLEKAGDAYREKVRAFLDQHLAGAASLVPAASIGDSDRQPSPSLNAAPRMDGPHPALNPSARLLDTAQPAHPVAARITDTSLPVDQGRTPGRAERQAS